MTLIFPSRDLGRDVAISEVWNLELDEARRLHVELTLAVQGIDDSIREAQRLEHDAGILFDRDWMHKARKKRRIMIMFASEARRRLCKLEGVEEVKQRRSIYEAQRDKFQQFRHDRLREMLKEELGPGVLEEIENDAHESAEEDFEKWLKRERFERVYQP